MATLNHTELKRLLHYDPETGVFTWRVRRSCHASPGSEAGYVHKESGGPYLKIKVFGKLYGAHRLAWFWMTGAWPAEKIDHRDGDGLNNRWGNLREATSAQNSWNSKRRISNTTGFKGVYLFRSTGRYYAQIKLNGKSRHLGYRDTPEEAHMLYCDAARLHFGQFARAE